MEAAHLGKSQEADQAVVSARPGAFPIPNTRNLAASSESVSSSAPVSENKLNWQQQKEEQARLRKRQNELKKTEEEITKLETRSDEIDNLLTLEEVYTNVEKLIELNSEKKAMEARLEELLEKWEELAGE
jgi:ATP-binding cassette subfamily F protein 3